jgi:hypothetical protein
LAAVLHSNTIKTTERGASALLFFFSMDLLYVKIKERRKENENKTIVSV